MTLGDLRSISGGMRVAWSKIHVSRFQHHDMISNEILNRFQRPDWIFNEILNRFQRPDKMSEILSRFQRPDRMFNEILSRFQWPDRMSYEILSRFQRPDKIYITSHEREWENILLPMQLVGFAPLHDLTFYSEEYIYYTYRITQMFPFPWSNVLHSPVSMYRPGDHQSRS